MMRLSALLFIFFAVNPGDVFGCRQEDLGGGEGTQVSFTQNQNPVPVGGVASAHCQHSRDEFSGIRFAICTSQGWAPKGLGSCQPTDSCLKSKLSSAGNVRFFPNERAVPIGGLAVVDCEGGVLIGARVSFCSAQGWKPPGLGRCQKWKMAGKLEVMTNAHRAMEIKENNMKTIYSSSPKKEHPASRMLASILEASIHLPSSILELSQDIQKKATMIMHACKDLGIQYSDPGLFGEMMSFKKELPGMDCLTDTIKCDRSSNYRTIDGFCNNLAHVHFGAASSIFVRLLPPCYDDGIDAARINGLSGFPLPSARAVSLAVHKTTTVRDPRHSHMLMQWGQFLDHDITLTPMAKPAGDFDCPCDTQCCAEDANCFPIIIPAHDPVFPTGSCTPFFRSQPGQLRFGWRQQLNQITSFIDASNVYGSDTATASALRSFFGGQLRIQEGYLPPPPSAAPCTFICFFAGDVRANEHLGLASMHTLWLQHHNYIAERLRLLVPTASDELLYQVKSVPDATATRRVQETRRIIIAQQQLITYKEFLPRVLGETLMRHYELKPRRRGYFTGYDPHCDATISNEFATAAFRFGHSLIGQSLKLKSIGKETDFHLAGNFFKTQRLFDAGILESLWRGMLSQRCQAFDRFAVPTVRDHLFGNASGSDGLDLMALNIQRGRDHGLQPYVAYRRHFNLSVPRSFLDLQLIMDSKSITALQSIYSRVEDMDLYPGLMSEQPVRGGVVGELAGYIIAEQFRRLKKCDRFYFENRDHVFTPKMLQSIRADTSLSKIIYHLVESRMPLLPADAFGNSPFSPNLPCKSMAGHCVRDERFNLDLKPWVDYLQNKTELPPVSCFDDQKIPPRCLSLSHPSRSMKERCFTRPVAPVSHTFGAH